MLNPILALTLGRVHEGVGRAPSSALRAPCLQMISGKQYAAPYYWAPLVLVGDWR
ncbi:MAG TPA: hypothetical protein VF240_10690 [Pyrinomonadaceae bacterium]